MKSRRFPYPQGSKELSYGMLSNIQQAYLHPSEINPFQQYYCTTLTYVQALYQDDEDIEQLYTDTIYYREKNTKKESIIKPYTR